MTHNDKNSSPPFLNNITPPPTTHAPPPHSAGPPNPSTQPAPNKIKRKPLPLKLVIPTQTSKCSDEIKRKKPSILHNNNRGNEPKPEKLNKKVSFPSPVACYIPDHPTLDLKNVGERGDETEDDTRVTFQSTTNAGAGPKGEVLDELVDRYARGADSSATFDDLVSERFEVANGRDSKEGKWASRATERIKAVVGAGNKIWNLKREMSGRGGN